MSHKDGDDIEMMKIAGSGIHIESSVRPEKPRGYSRESPEDEHRPLTEAERRLLLKADLSIIPLAAMVFLVSYMVRSP